VTSGIFAFLFTLLFVGAAVVPAETAIQHPAAVMLLA
jgi:hypothetical protein